MINPWLKASSEHTQRIKESDTPQVIVLDILSGSSRVGLDTATGAITIEHASEYSIAYTPQVGRSEGGDTANFRCWLRINGDDLPYSNVLMTLASRDVKNVIAGQELVHLDAGDVIEVIMASDNAAAGVGIEAIQPTPNEPLVPSIIFSLEAIQPA